MGEPFYSEDGQIADPKIAEDIGGLEKPARDLESSLKRLSEGGLTAEEEKHAKVLHTLLDKYPNAFDHQNDGQGRIILKSLEPARSGAVYLWVSEKGAVEIHSSTKINHLSGSGDNLEKVFENYLRKNLVDDIGDAVSGKVNDHELGGWTSFPRGSTLPLLNIRKCDLLSDEFQAIWKPVLVTSNQMNALRSENKKAEPDLKERLANL